MSYITYQGKRVNFAGKPIKTSSLHTDLVGYWKLDEVDGSVNASYGNMHGSLYNPGTGVIQNQSGKINTSYLFNRESSGGVYLQKEQFYGYQKDFTFAAWVNWDDSSTGYLGIIGAEYQGAGYGILSTPAYNYIYFESTAYDYTQSPAGFCPSANQWSFVAVVIKYIDATHTSQIYYVNDSSSTSTKTWAYPVLSDRSTYSIGIRRPDGPRDFFNGYIDEVGIWERALSNDEILSLYNGSAGKSFPFMQPRQSLLTGLTAYWKLDEIDGSVYDSCGNIGAGYIQFPAGISQNQSGKINTCYSFSSVDKGVIILPEVAALDMYNKSFSFSAWIKRNGLNDNAGILGGESLSASFVITGNDTITIGLQSTAMEGYGSYPLVIPLDSSNAWHFVALTYDCIDASHGNLVFYIDSSYYSVGTIAWTYPIVQGRPTYAIGARRPDQQQSYFNGEIDEVGIWRRALSANDVSLLYNSGYGRTYPFNEYFDNNIGIVRNGTFDTSAYWDLIGAGLDTYISNGRLYFHNVTYAEVIQSSTNMISPIKPNTDYVLNFDVDISTESVGTMRLKFVNETHAVDYVAYNNYAANSHVVNFKTPSDIGTGGFGIRYGLGYEGDGGYIDNVRLREKY